MASIYSLRRDLQRYYNLRDSINNMMGYLANSINDVASARKGIVDSFTIDGESADNGLLLEIEDRLSSKQSTLNDVIAEIDCEIERLNREISYEEAKRKF